jgi:hypothetical protein
MDRGKYPEFKKKLRKANHVSVKDRQEEQKSL